MVSFYLTIQEFLILKIVRVCMMTYDLFRNLEYMADIYPINELFNNYFRNSGVNMKYKTMDDLIICLI